MRGAEACGAGPDDGDIDVGGRVVMPQPLARSLQGLKRVRDDDQSVAGRGRCASRIDRTSIANGRLRLAL
jgi:hypothetical protein